MGEGYDDLVLGGGAAGCVVAARLSEDPGRRVCLVEAGPDYGPLGAGRWPADLLDSHQLPISHDWPYDDEMSWSACVIGGCSAHNACVITWGADADIDEWGDGWSAAALDPHRRRAEHTIGIRRRTSPGAWHEAVFAAAREAGFPELEDPNAAGAAVGVANVPVNDRDGVRWNAALAYLDAARMRPNLTILERALADRIELAGGRARGAWIVRERRPALIESERVIVAAGAYGSPAVLLRSGVGPEEELRRHDISVAVPLAGVGANLRNHWTARIMLDPGPTLAAAIAAEAAGDGAHMAGTVVKARSGLCEPELWDLHLLAICWGLRDAGGRPTGEHVLRISAAALRPRSAGRVALRSVRPEDPPAIEHRPLSDPEGADLEMLVDGLGQALRIAAAPSLAAAGVRVEAPADGRAETLRDHARATLGCYYHPVGTCAIGPAGSPAAVVSGDGAVHGLEGVAVVDASILPTIPRANPHLAVLAAAERLAAGLR